MSDIINLPPPRLDSSVSVESAIRQRRSVRQYQPQALSLEQISQLLWAAQGITHHRGFRSVPSAGALYPLEIYLVAGEITDLSSDIYHYRPQGHGLVSVAGGDRRAVLCKAALGQKMVQTAAAIFTVCAVYQRMTRKYGPRGEQYVHMEAGHAGQNIALQCVALGLGCVMVGAFMDEQVRQVIDAPSEQRPLYLIPVGVV